MESQQWETVASLHLKEMELNAQKSGPVRIQRIVFKDVKHAGQADRPYMRQRSSFTSTVKNQKCSFAPVLFFYQSKYV